MKYHNIYLGDNNDEKSLIHAMLFICAFSLILAISASANQELPFTAAISATQTDGGWWAIGSAIEISSADGGILAASSVRDRCIWAFTNATIDAYPYLTYELPEGGTICEMTVSKKWDVEPEIQLDVTPGKHTVNLKELLSEQTTAGYTYVVVYADGEAALISGFALTDTDSSANTDNSADQDAPDTADVSSAVAVIAVLSAATVVVIEKKRR